MPHQFQCRSCPQAFTAVTEFIEHMKIHMVENETAKKLKTQKQNFGSSMLQASIDLKLENEEIQSYICGKDLNVKEISSQSQNSVDDNEIRKAN